MRFGPALLFCPADRPDRYAKAASIADTVILDLEDAVAADAKVSARASLVESSLEPSRTVVRVNPARSGLLEADLAALGQTAYRTVMLAKTETLADLVLFDNFDVIALCESPLGVVNAELIASHPSVAALTWGAEDLVAGLGGSSSRSENRTYRQFALYARSKVLIAAASKSKPAFDTVHLDIADVAGLRDEATDAAASGFTGTLCIHPSQVAVVRSAFRPTADAVRWAEGVLAASAASHNGVFAYQGRMVDEPVIRQAKQILTLAESSTHSNEGSAES
jgi:citrate lyase subunit beta/citryl-CoA lyase